MRHEGTKARLTVPADVYPMQDWYAWPEAPGEPEFVIRGPVTVLPNIVYDYCVWLV